MRVGRWFIAGLWAFGVLTGVAAAVSPSFRDLPVPALVWPLAASLVVDLALMPLAQAGRIAPLTFNERAIAVVGAGLLQIVVGIALQG